MGAENDYDPRLISAMSEVRNLVDRRLPVGQQSARLPAIWRRLIGAERDDCQQSGPRSV